MISNVIQILHNSYCNPRRRRKRGGEKDREEEDRKRGGKKDAYESEGLRGGEIERDDGSRTVVI